jgi:hypothetical protein
MAPHSSWTIPVERARLFTGLLQSGYRPLTDRVDDALVRLLIGLASLIVALSLAGSATAATLELTVDRGVVQSVSASRIVLRELDGRVVGISVAARTRVLVNGSPATLSDIRPGFVASVVHDGSAPARLIRAFGRIQPTIDRGVVVSLAARVLTIRTPSGTELTFRISARTRIRWRGLPATIAAIRPGRLVVVAHTAGGEALRLAVRPRRLPER